MSECNKSSSEYARQVSCKSSAAPVLNVRMLAGAALIAVVVMLVYFPALSGGFILDDMIYVTNQPLNNSLEGLYQFWFTTEAPDYYPASNTTLWIEWRLWGMKPTGYHVTNLILHIVESLLIWVILQKLSIPGAFLAALIFAVHPVNVESVAWIAQRKGLMAILFFLLSILWYLKFEIPSSLSSHHSSPSSVYCPPSTVHRPLFYWLSLAAFVLAMLSKGSAAVLPMLLLGIVWWRRMGTVPIFASAKMGLSPSVSRRDLLRIAPFFLVAVVLTGVNLLFMSHATSGMNRSKDFLERLLGAGGVVWFYLYKALLPLNLCFVYPQWHIQVGNLLWWLPLLATAVVTWMLWRYRKGWSRPFLFAWGFFCVSLIPVLGFADVGFMQYSLVADHYQHIAIIGVTAFLAAGWSVWHKQAQAQVRSVASAVAVLVVGAITFLTWQQSGLYRNAMTLYQATLEKNPDCWMIHNDLGNILLTTGQLHEAIEHYKQSLRLKPDYVESYNNLSAAFIQAGRPQEAIKYLNQALQLDQEHISSWNNLAEAYAKINRPAEAIAASQKALELARSQGQTALAEQIEDWLNTYRRQNTVK